MTTNDLAIRATQPKTIADWADAVWPIDDMVRKAMAEE